MDETLTAPTAAAELIRVAVVIVSYRSAAMTIECLRSIAPERSLPGIAINVVVVDNASGDFPVIADALRVEGWNEWVVLLEASRNGGFAFGNNLGFSHAVRLWSPHYLLMLNPDTRITSGAVYALVDFLERNPLVGIAGSSFENGDGSDWPIAFRFPSVLSELESGLGFGLTSRLLHLWVVARIMDKNPQSIDWCCGASMMLRRSMLATIGGLDERFFLYFEETEFCWRAARAGFQTWYVPDSHVVHIAGQSTRLTERGARPERLPDYWYESRRRYFQLTLGLRQAALADLAALIGGALGRAKMILQGRRHLLVPGYLASIWRHSVFHRRNRRLAKPITPLIPIDQAQLSRTR